MALDSCRGEDCWSVSCRDTGLAPPSQALHYVVPALAVAPLAEPAARAFRQVCPPPLLLFPLPRVLREPELREHSARSVRAAECICGTGHWWKESSSRLWGRSARRKAPQQQQQLRRLLAAALVLLLGIAHKAHATTQPVSMPRNLGRGAHAVHPRADP